MKILDKIIAFIVGALFIFSGLVKLDDPMGTQIKLGEYFEVFSYDFGHFFEWFVPYSMPIGFALIVLEVVLGIALLLHYRMKITSWALVIIIGFFTFLTFLQLFINDPLASPVLVALETRLAENPDDQGLREEVRALDLMARKAYFTSQWQIKTGSIMLLISIIVLLLAFKTMGYPRAKAPDLSQKLDEGIHDAAVSRRWVAATGIIVLVIGLGSILFSRARPDFEGGIEGSIGT